MKTETPKSDHNHLWPWFKNGCLSFNIQNIKDDDSLFSLRNIRKMQKNEKIFLAILVVPTNLIILDNWENNLQVHITVGKRLGRYVF